jgi:hypothetical protein
MMPFAVEIPGFLDAFFSVPPSSVDRILTESCAKGYHYGINCTSFPEHNAAKFHHKMDFYKLFVIFITDEYSTASRFNLHWLSDPS